jgi:cytochrome b6-f complex iron-sulfur subunit
MQCTHQACSLQLPSASSGGNLACPCHGSLFTVQGAVVRGPAVAPLRSFAATIDTADGQVVVANA